jgi:hypothetical protein
MSKLNCKVVDVIDHDYSPENGVTTTKSRELYANGSYMGSLPTSAGKKDIINHCNTLGMCAEAGDVEVVFDTTPRVENAYLNTIGL